MSSLTGPTLDASSSEKFKGEFSETAAGASLGYELKGKVKMRVDADGTEVEVKVKGLSSSSTYGSHLHNGPCDSGGGGHYQDAEGGLTTPPNELWLSSSDDAFGGISPSKDGDDVKAEGFADWAARTGSHHMTNARSVVIHAPGGARIGCADLEGSGPDAASSQKLKGKFSETAAGASLGYELKGKVKMRVDADGTEVEVKVKGLSSSATYGSHLHNGTCASGGGGHYQDAEGGLTTPPNELWLSSSDDPFGGISPSKDGDDVKAEGFADWPARTTSNHMTNARSVVIHAPDGTRIGCADLT